MADLSKLSTADLQALQAGNLAAVSTEGLKALRGMPAAAPAAAHPVEAPAAKTSTLVDVGGQIAQGIVKGLPNMIDMVGAAGATLADKAMGGDKGWGETFTGYANMRPTSNAVDAALGTQERQAETTLGRYANIAGQAVGSLPLGGIKALTAPMAARALASGAAAGAGADAGAPVGGYIGEIAGGAEGRKVGEVVGGLGGGLAAAVLADRKLSAAGDALTGAAVGAVIPVGLAGAGKALQGTKQAAKIATRAVVGAKPQQVIEEVVARSRLTPEQIRQQIASGKISTIADVAGDEVQGLTRALGKVEGSRNIIADALEGRSQQAANRIVGQLTKSVSNVDAYFGNIDDVVAARSKMAAPLYDEAYSANQTIQSKVIDNILETPTGKRALAEASRKMQDQMARMGVPDAALTRQVRSMGVAAEGGVARGLNLQSLDYVKRSFDDMIGMAKRSGAMDEVRSLTQTKNTLLGELDKADKTGKYALARKVFSDQTAIKEAQEAGLQFKNLTPEQLQRTLKGMEPAEREAFRIGVRERLQREVLNTPDKADAAKRIFGNPTERQQLEAVLGKGKQFDEFAARMKEEIRAADTKFKLLGGSRTDINLSSESQLEGVMGRVARGDIKGGAIDMAVDFIGSTLRRRYYGLNEKNAQEIARALVDRKAGLEALDKIIAKQSGQQQSVVREAVDAMRSFAVQNANPTTPASKPNPMRNSQRGSLQGVSAPVAVAGTAAGALAAGNFASSLAVPNEGPAQDAWANQPRDVRQANDMAKQLDQAAKQDLRSMSTEQLKQMLAQVRAPMPAPVSATFIIAEEGFRPTAYKDSVGITTIGYGFNLEQPNARDVIKRVKIPETYEGLRSGREHLSQDSARKLFDYKHRKSEAAAASIVTNFASLGENQRAALTSMAYHMGGTGLRKFRQTLAYLKQGNAKAVENQLLSSLMAEQTPARAQRTALMLAYNLSPQEAEQRLLEQGRISPQERQFALTN